MSDHQHEHRVGQSPRPRLKLDLTAIRGRLAAARGPRYWRCLEELADSPEFAEMLEDEFPPDACEWRDVASRRNFLKLMSASLALAGLSACTRQPPESIVPYVRQPEELVPGKPQYYATAMPLGGIGLPLLAESHMGRPIKVEGNPQHPASQGASDALAQASILGLYDPDRSQIITYLGEVRPWGEFLGAMRGPVNAQKSIRGAGLRFLTGTVSSPTLAWQLRSLLAALPEARWHQYQPVNRDPLRAGLKQAFGRYLDPHYRLDQADVIVSLDADFLSGSVFPGFLRYARDFAARRKLVSGVAMNRLYAVESFPSPTGAKADHRLPMPVSEIPKFAWGLALSIIPRSGGVVGSVPPEALRWQRAIVRDLQQHRGSSVIIAGEQQPPLVHRLAAEMNYALGNVGKTVIYADPAEAEPVEQVESLRQLVEEMRGGKIDLLVILGGNPVFDAPADLDFAGALKKVTLRVHHSLFDDETSELCHWHVSAAHYLESWSDVRAYDGTTSIIQPLIAPLYEGKTEHEVVAAFTDQPELSSYDAVRNYWKRQRSGPDFEVNWRRWLHDGFIPDTAPAPLPVKIISAGIEASSNPPAKPPSARGIELVFRPDPNLYDGCFANNGWLQELPRPITKLTWDNAAIISPALADGHGLQTGDMVEIEHQGRKAKAPVYVLPGHADNSITLHLGNGRRRSGRSAADAGFDFYPLRSSEAMLFASEATLQKTGGQYALAITQDHHLIEGAEAEKRELVRVATLAEFQRDPDFARKEQPPAELTLYPQYEYKGHAWGMAIDLNSCVGCNACVVACQAENNIAIVGKSEVLRGREMHWLRIDTYFEGRDLDNPRLHFQPVPCMHCENAPCEPVCPVAATVHSSEGLNDMVYNRCVGTRYCQNNCPYKVRRFNFLLYSDFTTPSLKLMRNPEVTVRSRGVMEKCTYCVQRITRARINAEKEDRMVRDGEMQTACQQACPTDAIIFGNINDPGSRVARLKAGPRNYGLLAELNTRPRTTYIAGVRNPNPELEGEGGRGRE